MDKLYTVNGLYWAGNGSVIETGGGAAPDAADFGLVVDSPTVTSNLGLVTELVSTEIDYGSVVADIYGVIHGNLIYANTIPGNRLVSTTDITVANVTATDSVIADAIASNYITAGDIDVVTLTTTGTANVGSGSGNVITASGDVVVTGNLVIKNTLIGGGTAAGGVVPPGGIIMWSGSEAAIPVGWYLCNGSNGTPDLRSRFVIGAGTGSSYAVGATGGSADAVVVEHTHTITDPGHRHNTALDGLPGTSASFESQINKTTYASANGGYEGYYARGVATTTQADASVSNIAATGISINSNGSSATNANLPPYYALCFIMKS